MEKNITPVRIANSIGLDKSFIGVHLLVEGKKDIKLYRKFFVDDFCKIHPTFGKYKMRSVYEILSDRGFNNKLAIRDADYLRIPGNPKYDLSYGHSIYVTDCHDSEGMIINSNSFNNLINTYSENNTLSTFEEKNGNIRDLIYELVFKLGCLRLANKTYSLGLSFKPDRPEGNPIKYKKFICKKTFKYLGDDLLVNTLIEYSKNRDNEISSREIIIDKLNYIYSKNYCSEEIVNGHDLSHALFIVLKFGLKSKSKTLQDSDCMEDLLYISYQISDFSRTCLYININNWQVTNCKEILVSA